MVFSKEEMRDMAKTYADEIGEDVVFYPEESHDVGDYDYMERSAFEANGHIVTENDEVIEPTM